MGDLVLIEGPTVRVLPAHVRAMTVHGPEECAGRTCVIHSPTGHLMRGFPLYWRGDRGIFERLCPHGIGHPDPDQQDYWRELAAGGRLVSVDEWTAFDYAHDPEGYVSAQMIHGCDGCCGS